MNEDARFEAGPYLGLRPFGDSDLDALLFFGRGRERAVLVANLLVSRLTVLYGPSGVGKSSLVRAGVAHELRAQIARDGGNGRVVVYGSWAGDPRAGLVAAIEEECGALGPAAGLADAAASATQRAGAPLFLVLDQFEEYFLYHGAGPLALELPELVGRPGLEVNVLISIRDDALSQLDVFKAAIPDLFANVLRLDRLDREGARTAIVAPLEPFGELTGRPVTIEPELVEEVLDQVAADGFEGLQGAAAGADAGRGGRVETPYLQLVLARLWREETGSGSASLKLSTLERLGGAEAIVRDHLEGALASLSDRQRDAVAAVLNQLVTPSGTKIAHRPADLAQYAQLPAAELEPVLATLVGERILRRIEASGSEPERCEIFHDVLAGPIADWRSSWAVERERRRAARQRRRLLLLSGGALLALAVVIGIAVFAFVQRSHARADARQAQARELAASALAELPVNGETALGLALRAARLAPGEQTQEVLRETLAGSHERAVVGLGDTVTVTTFSRSGSRLLVASELGLVHVLDRQGRVLWTRHAGGSLAGALFTPDGRSVVGGGGSTVRIWSVDGGRMLRELSFPDRVTGLDIVARPGSSGTLIVSDLSGVKLVPLDPAQKLRRLSTPGAPMSVRVSSDGRLLAAIVAGAKGQTRVCVFDLENGRLLHVLPGLGPTAIAFSPDGRLLATGGGDRFARLWNPRSGKLLHTLPHEGRVPALSFSPDGRMLATGSGDGATRVWDTRTGVRLLILAGPIGAINSVAFSSSGRFLIAGSSDRTARVYEVDNGRELAVLTGDTDSVTAVAMSPDERLALTGSADRTARIWDPGVADQLLPIDRAEGPVREVTFSPDGKTMLIARDRVVRLRRSGGRLIASIGAGSSRFVAVSFSPDSQLLALESSDGLVRVYRGGEPLARIQTELGRGIAFAGDDRLLAIGRQRVDVWGLPGGRHLRALALGERVTALAASYDGSTAAVLSGGVVGLWNPETGKSLGRLAGRADAVGFSPDGRRLVTAYGDRAFLWGIDRDLLHVLAGHKRTITHFAFSPRGNLLVTGSLDHDARIWSLVDGRLLKVLRGHFSPIYGVSTSPDGSWVVTAGQLAVGLWRSTSGQLLYFLRGASAPYTGVSFGADGRSILAGSRDGAAYLYRCDVCGSLASLEALARKRLALAPAD
ncbi:MAG: WD40 repeat domain-containing protein [Gaiellaceae bacterium]|jgi:WD40 repeat protein